MKNVKIISGITLLLMLGISSCMDSKRVDPNAFSEIEQRKEKDSIAESNLQVALKFVNEGLSEGKMSAFDTCVDPNVFVVTGLKPSGPIQGLEEYKGIFSMFLNAWPKIDFEIEESFAVNDKVVIRFNSINKFSGEFYGMQPTNQIASLKEVHVMTLKEGKIINNVVSATNLEYEFILYPLLKDGVLSNVKEDQDQ